MKWVIATGLLVSLVRFGEGGAIRCTSGNDASCSETAEEAPSLPVAVSQDVTESPSLQVECLAGSEWESNCHYCRCSESGITECLKQDICGDGVFAEPLQCKPNTTFTRDCNTCACLDSGLALCTLDYCRRSGIPKKSELVAGNECAPGSTWKSNCNDCRCTDAGYSQCSPLKCEDTEKENTLRCAPDTMWKRDCNTCWCTADGRAMCTKIGCATISHIISINYFDKEANGNYQDKDFTGPNLQTIDDGLKDDNRNDPNQILHNLVKRSVCKPNQEFQSECNSCKCSADGQRYNCTQNECLERDMTKEVEVFMESEGVHHIERHSVCKPHDTFYIGCNTCHCNYDGTDYSCTNKPCPLPEDVELFHELKITKSSKNNTMEVVCAANRMFIKDCNTCWCNDDGTSYFCTRKVCVPEQPDEANPEEEKPEELRIIKKECRPDEVFELDCNMCRCNPDGKSFLCTRRACIDQEDAKNTTLSRRKRATPQEAPKNCQPGQEFRLDCNKCLCDNEGQDFSCTRIDCNANNNNNGGGRSKRETGDLEEISSECTPGSVFQRDCNTCRCTADGKHALCTHKRCQQPEPKGNQLDSDVHSTEPDPGFRCDPGEQFKRDCKDCTCSADGKSYFCTIHLCDEFTSP